MDVPPPNTSGWQVDGDDDTRSNMNIDQGSDCSDGDSTASPILPGDSHKPNRELIKLVAVAATTAATLGYDVGSMAGAIGSIDAAFQLTSVQKELAMGSLNFLAAGGALLGGPFSDRFGRKRTVAFTCWLFLLGTIFMAFAPGYGSLLIGRMVAGLGVGVSFIAAPVFISEVSPPSMRGELNTTFDVAINSGILIGYVAAYVIQVIFPVDYNWRIMLGIGGIFPAIVLGCLSGLPESPRWLVLDGQKPAAKLVLHRLGSSEIEIDEAIAAMEGEINADRANETQRSNRSCHLSRGKRMAVGLGFWQQISGTEAVLYYSADFLARAGLESPELRLLGNVAVGLSKLIPELIVMRLVDNVGRRPLLMTSAFLLAFTILMMGVAFLQSWSPLVVVVLLCAIMASFSIGVGPFTFLCVSENLDLSERAKGTTISAAVNRCTSGIIAMTAVTISEVLTDAGLFFLYGLFGVGALVFYANVVPETSGATLEELAAARAGADGRLENCGDGHLDSYGGVDGDAYDGNEGALDSQQLRREEGEYTIS